MRESLAHVVPVLLVNRTESAWSWRIEAQLHRMPTMVRTLQKRCEVVNPAAPTYQGRGSMGNDLNGTFLIRLIARPRAESRILKSRSNFPARNSTTRPLLLIQRRKAPRTLIVLESINTSVRMAEGPGTTTMQLKLEPDEEAEAMDFDEEAAGMELKLDFEQEAEVKMEVEHPVKMELVEEAGWTMEADDAKGLLGLPDSLLVRVLGWLGVFDVVRCRQACRRLLALSTRPEVWEHRTFDDNSMSAAKAQRVALELAPCARSLSVAARWSLRAVAVTGLAARTCCAARELTLSVDSLVRESVAVLQRQAELGCLRSLILECRQNPEAEGDEMEMGDLLSIVFTIASLEDLCVAFTSWKGLSQPLKAGMKLLKLPDLPPKPSLKSLIYSVSEVDPFLEWLLRLHGPSLEKVALGGVVGLALPLLEGLAAMANLHTACVPLAEGVHLLLRCGQLTKLTLVAHRPSPQALADGQELLRAATGLTTVKIKAYRYQRKELERAPRPKPRNPPPSAYDGRCTVLRLGSDLEELFALCRADDAGAEDVVAPALVKALASSGRSRVQRLSLWVAKEQLPAGLVGALPGLAELTDLRLQQAPDGFLRGIRPAVAPRLARLHAWWLAAGECKHGGLLHDRAQMRRLKELLRRNPGLHLTVNYSACAPSQACRHCKAHCHGELADSATLGFTDHDPDPECAECEDEGVTWHPRLVARAQ